MLFFLQLDTQKLQSAVLNVWLVLIRYPPVLFFFIPNKYLEEAQARSEAPLIASFNQTCFTHSSAAFQFIWIMHHNC